MASLEETRAATEDFFRFYIRGGAEAARAGTKLLEATPKEVEAALAKFDAEPEATRGAAATIETEPLDAFIRTPGIARRMPAIVGVAPDFLSVENADLPKPATFARPADALPDPTTLDIRGPVVATEGATPLTDDDVYADMCAMEDAVVLASGDELEVAFLWVRDYPVEVLESATVPDPRLATGVRLRPVLDAAQPSVVATECMEALQSFLGPQAFQEHSFTWRVELCGFEELANVRQSLQP